MTSSARSNHFPSTVLAKGVSVIGIGFLGFVISTAWPDSSHDSTARVIVMCFLLLSPLIVGAALVSFFGEVVLEGERLVFKRYLPFSKWEVSLSNIKRIRIETTSGPAEIPTFQLYVLCPHRRGKGSRGGVLGPWIKNYRQLLRDIILRVPPDCVVDAEVLEVIKRP